MAYAELAVFFPSSSHNHRQYSFRLPGRDDQAELPRWVGGWLRGVEDERPM